MVLVLPLIEIRAGKSVWSIQQIPGRKFDYPDDPVELAKLWRKENAKALHIGDLDGIDAGTPVHFELVKKIVEAVDIPIEFGGGIRKPEDAEAALLAGVYRISIGTMVVESPDATADLVRRFGPRRIAVSIDVHGDKVFIRGGKQSTPLTSVDLAMQIKSLGVQRVIYFDTARSKDEGPDLDQIQEFARVTGLKITLAEEVSTLDDLLRVQALEHHGIDSVVIGRPLYENRFSCQTLWRLGESGDLRSPVIEDFNF